MRRSCFPDSSDNRLVIALHGDKVYARRLLRDPSKPGIVVLASDAPDPKRRPPSLQLPAAEVRLLKVVGILFDERPQYPRSSQEAAPAKDMSCLERVEIAFKVTGESAEPLALPGQTVLGGRSLTPEDLASMEGALVAVATTDGAIFKRVGAVLSGAKHVRLLEAVGGLGASLVVRTEEVDEDPFHQLPLVQAAREVIGVIYE